MKIALIELSESHEECLYTQLCFLKQYNLEPTFFVHPKIEAQIGSYELPSQNIRTIKPTKQFFKRWKLLFQLVRVLATFDKVIFNTASSSKFLRDLVLLLRFYPVECVGILHHTKKLSASFTQRLISSKIKKYFVLADHLVPKETNGAIKISSFYPIFFPPYPKTLVKPVDEIWICIPVGIDFKRRDYYRLLNALADKPILKNLRFILLGKLSLSNADAVLLKESITSKKLEPYFVLFEDFVANEQFHNYLQYSDFILPLLTLNEEYLQYKISGSFNLAHAYHKPMLAHTFFKELDDIRRNGVFYDETTLYAQLTSIAASSIPKEYHNNAQWVLEQQSKKYIDFLMI